MASAHDVKDNPEPAGDCRPAAAKIYLSPGERLILGGILLVASVIYLRSLGNGFVYDDDALILSNTHIGEWSFLWKSLTRDLFWFIDTSTPVRYRPLLPIWFALSYHLFGFSPAGWHAMMIAVHLVAVWLVFLIARGLTGRGESALLAAALFALLPVHAEAVVWPSGFGLVMAGTLMLASFYFFSNRHDTRGGPDARRNWTLALALYAAGLLSHESAAAFPGLVAWYVLLGEPGTEQKDEDTSFARRASRALACTVPFAIELLVYMFVRRYVLGFFLTDPHKAPNSANITQALMTVPRALAADLMLLAAPWMAGPGHRIDVVTSLASRAFYLPAAALIGLAGGLVACLWKSRRLALALFCAGWIPIAMAPMMDLHAFVADQFIHDNYLYAASFGWCVLLADWAVQLRQRDPLARWLVSASAAALLLWYASLLWQVEHYWHDDLTLFQRCVEADPRSWHCRTNLALTLRSRGDLEGAAREFKKSMSIEPDHPDAEYVLAQLDQKKGENAEAIALFTHAAKSLPRQTAASAYLEAAAIYESMADVAGASRALDDALKLDPDDAQALYHLGMIHARLGQNPEAVTELAKAIKLMTNPPVGAVVTLAELYDAQGDVEHRDETLRRASKLPDGEELMMLASARIKTRHGDRKGAEDVLRDLARRLPRDPRSWTALGLLLSDGNRNEESLSAFETAQRLSPNDPRPYFFAAHVLHTMGREREALKECRSALKLAPTYGEARSLQDEITRKLSAQM